MNIQRRSLLRPLVPAGLLLGLASLPAAAQVSTFTNFQPHAEEAIVWCGPATAQMVMEGYPAGPCNKTQDEIWEAIQAKKSETLWDTDPVGLRDAMKTLCPPPGGSWSVFQNTDAQALMHSVAFWMKSRKYPVAALLDTSTHSSYPSHQEHWVAIKGIVTDKDPATNATVTLQMVWFVDPGVPLGDPALDRLVTGSIWYSELKAVSRPGSAFNGKFVAVIEPPPAQGRAVAPQRVLAGTPLNRAAALRQAAQAIKTLRLDRFAPFRDLGRSKPLTPLLVNPRKGGYYLVPFSMNGRDARFAVLLNAYTGAFEEVASFAPTRIVSEQSAIERASPRLDLRGAQRPVAALTTSTEEGSRLQPVWKVEAEGREITVDVLEPVQPPGRPDSR